MMDYLRTKRHMQLAKVSNVRGYKVIFPNVTALHFPYQILFTSEPTECYDNEKYPDDLNIG